MDHAKKINVMKICAAALFIVAITVPAFPRWYINFTENAFDTTGQGSAAVSLEEMVKAGAGYFLDSYANTMSFLKESEGSDPAGAVEPGLVLLLDRAREGMERANNTFNQLKRLADATPYNRTVIGLLSKFDYDGFQAAYGIDDPTFARVRELLAKGDIRSIYGEIARQTGDLVQLLVQVKDRAEPGASLSNWDVWKLERAYAESLRYGQYTARVFDSLGIDR